MRKIAISNRKGGVGKTTTAVNLSAGLAMGGNQVLLIDADTQGHCSRLLGVNHEYGLADFLEGSKNASESVIMAREGLYLLTGDRNLEGISRLISKENIPMGLIHPLAPNLRPLYYALFVEIQWVLYSSNLWNFWVSKPYDKLQK